MTSFLQMVMAALETIGGARPIDRTGVGWAVALGLWWAALLLLILAFAGRATKFIYVDF
jgi:hypothetical protein